MRTLPKQSASPNVQRALGHLDRKDIGMRRTVSILIAAAVVGTAAPSVAQNDVGKNAVIGGAVGAGVGAVVGGINPLEGAALGAAGGAIVGLLSKDKREAKANYGDTRYGYYD